MTCVCVFTHTRGFHPDFSSKLNLLIHEPEDASFRAWTHGFSPSCRNARWEGCHRAESNSSVVVNQVFRNWDRRKKEKNRTLTQIDKKVILLKFKGNQKQYEPDTESDYFTKHWKQRQRANPCTYQEVVDKARYRVNYTKATDAYQESWQEQEQLTRTCCGIRTNKPVSWSETVSEGKRRLKKAGKRGSESQIKWKMTEATS